MFRPPFIIGLFNAGSPSDITGFVVTIDINTVNRMSGTRFGSDVGEEGSKRLTPFFTNGDASSAVVLIVTVPRIGNPLDQIDPGVIFRRKTVPSGRTMRSFTLTSILPSQATTRADVSRTQVSARDFRFIATHATTEPARLSLPCGIVDSMDNGQASEYTASEINQRHSTPPVPLVLCAASGEVPEFGCTSLAAKDSIAEQEGVSSGNL